MKNNSPIGLFDSGIGGTSIWKEIHQILPNENTIYLADSKNAPYGQKTKDEIVHLSEKNVEFLLNKNSKIIVIACNTATTNAIDYLRNKYKVPFIGLEPAIKPAALLSKTGIIGVLATQGTLSSASYLKAEKLFKNTQIINQIGFQLVSLIETGQIHSAKTKELLIKYLDPMVNKGIDHLVLGCTHYPYLIPIIEKIIPKNIKIIDSGLAVAKQTKTVLTELNLINKSLESSINEFYINTDSSVLKTFLTNTNSIYEIEF